MESPTGSFNQLGTTSKRFVRRLAIIGENRLELLLVELEEERKCVLRSFLLGLGVAVFALLASSTLTAAIAVLLWSCSPLAVLLTLTGLYGVGGICLYWRLTRLLRNWQTLPASLDQLRKDRACLEEMPT
jgi:uncharacterized membrane protein YqjE